MHKRGKVGGGLGEEVGIETGCARYIKGLLARRKRRRGAAMEIGVCSRMCGQSLGRNESERRSRVSCETSCEAIGSANAKLMIGVIFRVYRNRSLYIPSGVRIMTVPSHVQQTKM